jgi:hypothetical protein
MMHFEISPDELHGETGMKKLGRKDLRIEIQDRYFKFRLPHIWPFISKLKISNSH